MRRLGTLLLALLLLAGCEGVNATLVRQMHKDWGVSRRIYHQIREGLEKREGAPGKVQKRPAPPSLDQGTRVTPVVKAEV